MNKEFGIILLNSLFFVTWLIAWMVFTRRWGMEPLPLLALIILTNGVLLTGYFIWKGAYPAAIVPTAALAVVLPVVVCALFCNLVSNVVFFSNFSKSVSPGISFALFVGVPQVLFYLASVAFFGTKFKPMSVVWLVIILIAISQLQKDLGGENERVVDLHARISDPVCSPSAGEE